MRSTIYRRALPMVLTEKLPLLLKKRTQRKGVNSFHLMEFFSFPAALQRIQRMVTSMLKQPMRGYLQRLTPAHFLLPAMEDIPLVS